MKKIILLLSLFVFSVSCSQSDNERLKLDEKYARQELQKVLDSKDEHNVIDNKTLIIENNETAINFAELILFDIYGKKNIQFQRPYQVYKFDKYYVISGTLPKRSIGGTFIIIFDERIVKF